MDRPKPDSSDNAESLQIPRHVAIIMDGNGRWAQRQGHPRFFGHKAGLSAVRNIVEKCVESDIEILTLFAFSSENWKRPPKEVSLLMDLFMTALNREVKRLNRNNIRLKIIGDRSAFSEKLQRRIVGAEDETSNNTGLLLQIAANYGGRWDITQAARHLAVKVQQGELDPEDIDESRLASQLSTAGEHDPDLFIRTGGEQRLSNFLMWQSAYAELYLTDTLWPEFDSEAFGLALSAFSGRLRRFGKTTEQIMAESSKQTAD